MSARHQSAHRLLDETKALLNKRQADSDSAVSNLLSAEQSLEEAQDRLKQAIATRALTQEAMLKSEAKLLEIEENRIITQTKDSDSRSELYEAEGEANALRAEFSALERVIARDSADGEQLIDSIVAKKGYEAALGAALADDLKMPIIEVTGISGWSQMPDYPKIEKLPNDSESLSFYVNAPTILSRRLSQIGIVSQKDGPRLQADLMPGQRLVSVEGDLWRWDGFRQSGNDAPSAAALRLQQQNRLEELQVGLESAELRLDKSRSIFEKIHQELKDIIQADQDARIERKSSDEMATNASRQMSRSEADCDMLAGKVEALKLAKTRLEE